MSSAALPDPFDHAFHAIEGLVQAFADILNATGLAVVCQYAPTGDVLAVNHYNDLFSAMIAAWSNQCDDTRAEVHAIVPLTAAEAEQWD